MSAPFTCLVGLLIFLSSHLPAYSSTEVFVHLSIFLSILLFVHPFVHQRICAFPNVFVASSTGPLVFSRRFSCFSGEVWGGGGGLMSLLLFRCQVQFWICDCCFCDALTFVHCVMIRTFCGLRGSLMSRVLARRCLCFWQLSPRDRQVDARQFIISRFFEVRLRASSRCPPTSLRRCAAAEKFGGVI